MIRQPGNNRLAPRHAVALPIRFSNMTLFLEGEKASLLDLSLSGMKIATEGPLRRKDVLDVTLGIPVPPYSAQGLAEVVWAEPVGPDSRLSRAGLHFKDFPSELIYATFEKMSRESEETAKAL